MTERRSFIPVFLGGEAAAHSAALDFYSKFGVCSHAFVPRRDALTERAKFVKTHVCTELLKTESAVLSLLNFATANSCSELFLIPSSDEYFKACANARTVLNGVYGFHIPDAGIYAMLSAVGGVVRSCKAVGISVPSFSEREEYPTFLSCFSDGRGIVLSAVHARAQNKAKKGAATLSRIPLDGICFLLTELLERLAYRGFSVFKIGKGLFDTSFGINQNLIQACFSAAEISPSALILSQRERRCSL